MGRRQRPARTRRSGRLPYRHVPDAVWKWISDTHDWERAQAVAEYGEDVPAEAEADYHRFAVPTGTHRRQVTTRTDNLGTHIGTALARLEQANPDSLAGSFGDAAVSRDRH